MEGDLMEKKRRKGCLLTIIIFTILFLLFLDKFVMTVFHPLPYRSLAPFKGKVVEKGTEKPIPDAVVLVLYYKTGYMVAGEINSLVDAQETLTNKEGKFKIPRKRRWFVPERGYMDAEIIIFKPGYGAFPSHRESEAVGGNKLWPAKKRNDLYKLPKLMTKKERKDNLYSLRNYSEIPYSKQKNYFDKLNDEHSALGYSKISIPK